MQAIQYGQTDSASLQWVSLYSVVVIYEKLFDLTEDIRGKSEIITSNHRQIGVNIVGLLNRF